MEAFQVFDKNGSGSISNDSIRAILGEEYTNEEIEVICMKQRSGPAI